MALFHVERMAVPDLDARSSLLGDNAGSAMAWTVRLSMNKVAGYRKKISPQSVEIEIRRRFQALRSGSNGGSKRF